MKKTKLATRGPICPFSTPSDVSYTECKEDGCAWWVEGQCVIVKIANSLEKLAALSVTENSRKEDAPTDKP